jgi:hypothetical protein
MLGPADLPVAAGHPLRAAMAERLGPLAFAVMGSELVDTMDGGHSRSELASRLRRVRR